MNPKRPVAGSDAELERRLGALAEFIAAFEAAHGEITAKEMRAASRRARARAISVKGRMGS